MTGFTRGFSHCPLIVRTGHSRQARIPEKSGREGVRTETFCNLLLYLSININMRLHFVKQSFLWIFILGPHLVFCQSDTLFLGFDIGKTQLLPRHQEALSKYFAGRQIRAGDTLKLISSADFLGSEAINRPISDDRLASAMQFLSGAGYSDSLILMPVSRGEIPARQDELKPEGEPWNRTVKLIYLRNRGREIGENAISGNEVNPISSKAFANGKGRASMGSLDDLEFAGAGDKLVLGNLNFQPGRHVLLIESVPDLKKLLSILLRREKLKIEIRGHICCMESGPGLIDGIDLDTGTRDLSLRRAQNIYQFLIRNGIDSTRLEYSGFGSSEKIHDPELTEEQKKQNRRVEILVLENN